jgi:hypothetical protein
MATGRKHRCTYILVCASGKEGDATCEADNTCPAIVEGPATAPAFDATEMTGEGSDL